jgi:hypothetical protein
MPSRLSPYQLEQIAPKLPLDYPTKHFYKVWDDLNLVCITKDGQKIVLGSRIAEELTAFEETIAATRRLLEPKVILVPLPYKPVEICCNWLATVLNPDLQQSECWDGQFDRMDNAELFELRSTAEHLGVQQLATFIGRFIKRNKPTTVATSTVVPKPNQQFIETKITLITIEDQSISISKEVADLCPGLVYWLRLSDQTNKAETVIKGAVNLFNGIFFAGFS